MLGRYPPSPLWEPESQTKGWKRGNKRWTSHSAFYIQPLQCEKSATAGCVFLPKCFQFPYFWEKAQKLTHVEWWDLLCYTHLPMLGRLLCLWILHFNKDTGQTSLIWTSEMLLCLSASGCSGCYNLNTREEWCMHEGTGLQSWVSRPTGLVSQEGRGRHGRHMCREMTRKTKDRMHTPYTQPCGLHREMPQFTSRRQYRQTLQLDWVYTCKRRF